MAMQTPKRTQQIRLLNTPYFYSFAAGTSPVISSPPEMELLLQKYEAVESLYSILIESLLIAAE